MFKERFTFFYNGPFSNWYPCTFQVGSYMNVISHETFPFPTVHKYNCSEQYMMAEKARMFYDKGSLMLIMEADHPREQKKLGRQVQGFNKDEWEKHAKKIVYHGCMAKFTQNEDLLEELLKTDGTTLVEASPYDCIWGIGLHESDPLCQDRSTWRGTNWLGEVLTNVRNDIIKNRK